LAIGGYAVLRTIADNNPDLVNQLVEQVVPPEYQDQIINSYNTLPSGGAAFWIALIGLLLAGTGSAFALYAMVNQVFCVPYRFRYGFGPRYVRVPAHVVAHRHRCDHRRGGVVALRAVPAGRLAGGSPAES
jgi:hypothetical protein